MRTLFRSERDFAVAAVEHGRYRCIRGLREHPGISTVPELADYAGFKREFCNLFGFEVDGVAYDQAVETEATLE